MSTVHRFEEIEAWQTARKLRREVYPISAGDFSRDFGLCDQMHCAPAHGPNHFCGLESAGVGK